MPSLHTPFWRFNVVTQQYQQTNTWFLSPEFDLTTQANQHFFDDNDNNSDTFSYITQDFDTSSLTSDSEDETTVDLHSNVFNLYFLLPNTAAAA